MYQMQEFKSQSYVHRRINKSENSKQKEEALKSTDYETYSYAYDREEEKHTERKKIDGQSTREYCSRRFKMSMYESKVVEANNKEFGENYSTKSRDRGCEFRTPRVIETPCDASLRNFKPVHNGFFTPSSQVSAYEEEIKLYWGDASVFTWYCKKWTPYDLKNIDSLLASGVILSKVASGRHISNNLADKSGKSRCKKTTLGIPSFSCWKRLDTYLTRLSAITKSKFHLKSGLESLFYDIVAICIIRFSAGAVNFGMFPEFFKLYSRCKMIENLILADCLNRQDIRSKQVPLIFSSIRSVTNILDMCHEVYGESKMMFSHGISSERLAYQITMFILICKQFCEVTDFEFNSELAQFSFSYFFDPVFEGPRDFLKLEFNLEKPYNQKAAINRLKALTGHTQNYDDVYSFIVLGKWSNQLLSTEERFHGHKLVRNVRKSSILNFIEENGTFVVDKLNKFFPGYVHRDMSEKNEDDLLYAGIVKGAPTCGFDLSVPVHHVDFNYDRISRIKANQKMVDSLGEPSEAEIIDRTADKIDNTQTTLDVVTDTIDVKGSDNIRKILFDMDWTKL